MKIAVIAASGKQGHFALEEAIGRGHDVTAIVRNASKIKEDVPIIEKDILSLTPADVTGFDAVIDAFNVVDGHFEDFITVANHLIDIFTGLQTRLLVVGGASSLFTDASKKQTVLSSGAIPEAWIPMVTPLVNALPLFQNSSIHWTFVHPAETFDYEGPRTEKYKLGTDTVILNSQGESYVSYRDFAVALIDEIENDNYDRSEMTVVSDAA